LRRENVKILVVDDETAICSLVEDVLVDLGYSVVTRSNPTEALDLFKDEDIHVVITDVKMPGMSGVEFFRKCREYAPKVPVIVMTGYATLDLTIELLKLGASSFIRKPFELKEIELAVKKAVKLNRITGTRREYFERVSSVHSFEIGSDMRYVEPSILHSLDIIGLQYNLSAQQELDIISAMTEAVTNAIVHGNGGDSSKKVGIKLVLESGEVKIFVSDCGHGFDFMGRVARFESGNIFRENGRGIIMMNYYMDKLEFLDGGSTVMMVKRLRSEKNGNES